VYCVRQVVKTPTIICSNPVLPHIFVGDEAYPLTTYTMKPYSRRTLDRNKACAFGICASKWRILDKSIETKVDAGVEIVKYIAVLHSIIMKR